MTTGCGYVQSSSSTLTTTITVPGYVNLLTEGAIPGGNIFTLCEDGLSGIGSTVTSCPFAMNVRQEYERNESTNIDAFSPVMNHWYKMHCETGYTATLRTGKRNPAVRCDGGRNAIVIILRQ